MVLGNGFRTLKGILCVFRLNFAQDLSIKAAKSINDSNLTHKEIALKAGTFRTQNYKNLKYVCENSISIEILLKILVALENKIPLKVA